VPIVTPVKSQVGNDSRVFAVTRVRIAVGPVIEQLELRRLQCGQVSSILVDT
jgi:hypothetical protein